MARFGWSGAALGVALAVSAPARAAETRYALDIPAQPLRSAMVQLALQAGVSVSTGQAAACGPVRQRLVGRFSLSEAVSRLVAGTGCGYRLVDARAVEILAAPVRPPAPVRPAPVSAPPREVSELVVVATGRPTPADRLAYPVSALSAATLEAQGVRDAADVAQLTSGMMVTNLGSGRDKIILRGLSDGPLTGHSQSMVGVYLDDVRVSYNAPDPDLKLVDVAQVEVLRGPQGALYGSGSLGGVVHLVTGQPDPGGIAGWLSASRAWTRGGAASSTFEGMANLPLLSGRGAARLVVWREDQGGYIDDVGLGVGDANRTVRQGLRLSAGLDLNADWRLTGGWVSQAINAQDTQYATPALGAYRRANRLREPHDNDFAMAHLGLRGRTDWGEARLSLAWLRHELASRYDASAAPPMATAAGPVAFDDDNFVRGLIAEASLSSPADARVQWLAGLFLARNRQDLDDDLVHEGLGALLLDETRRDRLDEVALYGQAAWPVTQRATLTLGGRLFRADNRIDSSVASAGGTARFSGRVTRTGFAPKVVLAYDLASGVLVYAQAAEGYRSGGANTTGAPDQVFSGPNGVQPYRLYQGDELWSFELGARARLLDDRLAIRAAVFQADWRNIQSDALLPSGLPFTANIGDGRNRGLEVEASYRSGSLWLKADAIFNAPELSRANPSFPARSDLALAGAPEVSGAVSAHYGLPLAQGRSVELDARLAYVGGSRLTFDAKTAPAMGDYVTGRLAVSLVDSRWRVSVAVENPGDSAGDTFAYGNPFTLRTERQSTPLRPRTFSIGLKVSY
ncbi:TonB-dependent receptor [Phenylobacterium sp.]|uniref:TonB-dependent receptor n=1 Tax=Phenylobacterium sp. TaxID=1871053 RepID=UPI0035B4F067